MDAGAGNPSGGPAASGRGFWSEPHGEEAGDLAGLAREMGWKSGAALSILCQQSACHLSVTESGGSTCCFDVWARSLRLILRALFG
jgi:hypothetical protein